MASLQEEEARYRNETGATKHRPALPLYTEEDGRAVAARISDIDWAQRVPLGDSAMAMFHRAGHILGAASVHLEVRTPRGLRRVVFSGDVGRYDAPILRDPAPLGDADYVVVESTYGDRRHDLSPSRHSSRLCSGRPSAAGALSSSRPSPWAAPRSSCIT